MVRIGTPTDLDNYVILTYEVSSKIQEDSIFPIWRDDEYMYFEKTEEFFDYLERRDLYERID